MFYKKSNYLKIITISTVLLLITACDQLANVVEHSAISVDTNAHYSVYQKSVNENWKKITSNNASFGFSTITFTLDNENSAFTVMFVCPSRREDRAHEVHVFYATKNEMDLIDFNCRRSLDEIIEKPIYGSVQGVITADAANPEGEFVQLAITKDVSIDAWEAYGVMVRSGTRDIVAIKGKQTDTGDLIPEGFLIRRKVQLDASAVPFELDINFNEDSISFLNQKFVENSRSTVNVTGKSEGDIIQSNLSFLSRNKTVIDMISSDKESFTFLPVPLKKFTGTVGDFVDRFEFNPGEGHELLVSAETAAGKVSREVSKFFTVSDNVVHNMRLPKLIQDADLPLLSFRNVGDLRSITLNWTKYQDPEAGITRLYRWQLEGFAAVSLPDKVPAVNVERLKWIISVTPGWLKAAGARGNDYTLTIPIQNEVGEGDGIIDKDDAWRKEWAFKESLAVDWQMSVITVPEENKAGDVIDYLLNRNIDENLQFSQVYVRSALAQ